SKIPVWVRGRHNLAHALVCPSPHPSPRFAGRGSRPSLRAIILTARPSVLFTFQTPDLVPAARFLRPGFCLFASRTPMKGGGAPRDVRVLRHPWACTIGAGQGPSEGPWLPYGGRPPPGAHTVAILGAGAALPLAGIGAGSVIANSHVRVVVPGGGPLPPGATVPEPPPQDATPRSAFRMPPDDALR